MNEDTMNVVFIGSSFYRLSNTMMSSVYIVSNGAYSRTDWGKIQIALEGGANVNIRPATQDEHAMFFKKLEGMKK